MFSYIQTKLFNVLMTQWSEISGTVITAISGTAIIEKEMKYTDYRRKKHECSLNI